MSATSIRHPSGDTGERLSPAAAELAAALDPDRLPRHVAVIMDGNGRWARQRGRPRIFGHRQGVHSVREVVKACRILGVSILSLYAFSVENWQRPKAEVEALMRLLRHFLLDERETMLRHSMRLHAIGRIGDLPREVQATLHETMEATATGDRLVLNLALSYGGRAEIVDAVNRLLADVAAGRRDDSPLTEDAFSACLNTAGQADPDLLIRTSGEQRVSNFLLWQIAYTELYVTPVLWPDFRDHDFVQALLAYQQRERRFGKSSRSGAL